jgi:hypothetical protein
MILPQSMLAKLYNYIAIFNYAWINQKQNKNRPPMSLHFLDGSLSCQLTKLSHEKKFKKHIHIWPSVILPDFFMRKFTFNQHKCNNCST